MEAAEALGHAQQSALEGMEGDRLVLAASEGLRNFVSPTSRVDAAGPMRLVLMGRTMAGKSTLLAALTGKHADRVGDGRQRFSRDVLADAVAGIPGVEIVDTPGVGARDGEKDFETAMAAAQDADLILWVASNDSLQEETARALRILGAIGKPVLVVLNCRKSLARAFDMEDFLDHPEDVFAQQSGNFNRIRSHLNAAAVSPIAEVAVHAQAALRSVEQISDASRLRDASGIEQLRGLVASERDTSRDVRRVIRVADDVRREALLLRELAADATTGLARALHAQQSVATDLKARTERAVTRADEASSAAVIRLVGARRSWHLSVTDFGKGLNSSWSTEIGRLRSEIEDEVETIFTTLERDFDSLQAATLNEWSALPDTAFDLDGLPGFDSVLGNRIARAGLGVGKMAMMIAGAKAGAVAGAALGIETGPGALITGAIGAVLGGLGSLALDPLKDWIGTMFKGKAAVLADRRKTLNKQTGSVLDELQQAYLAVVATQVTSVRERISAGFHEADVAREKAQQFVSRWQITVCSVDQAVAALDLATAAALLRLDNREGLASSLSRVSRSPGVCILGELGEAAAAEAWLYPPTTPEVFAVAGAPYPSARAAQALSFVTGLADAEVRLTSAADDHAVLRIGIDVAPSLIGAWSDVLSDHTDAAITLESVDTAGRPRT